MLNPTVTPMHSLTTARVGIRTTIRLATVLLLCAVAGCATSHQVRLQQQGGECMSVPACYGYQPTVWHPWPESVSWGPATAAECDCLPTVIGYPEAAFPDVPPADVIPPSLPQEVPGTILLPEPPESNPEPPVGQQSWLEPWAPSSQCQRLPSPERYTGTRLEDWEPALQPAAGAPPSRL